MLFCMSFSVLANTHTIKFHFSNKNSCLDYKMERPKLKLGPHVGTILKDSKTTHSLGPKKLKTKKVLCNQFKSYPTEFKLSY